MANRYHNVVLGKVCRIFILIENVMKYIRLIFSDIFISVVMKRNVVKLNRELCAEGVIDCSKYDK